MTETNATLSLASVIAGALAFKAAEFDDWRFYVERARTQGNGVYPDDTVGPFPTREDAQAFADDLDDADWPVRYVEEDKEGRDLSVSGADVVDFFTQLRIDLRAARADVNADMRDAVQNMRDLIDTAMDVHIYDGDQGEGPDEDCGYQAAVDRADELLAITADGFTPPPVGALEIIRDLVDAVSNLDDQIGEDDGEDDAIQQARDEGDEATKRADLYVKAVGANPRQPCADADTLSDRIARLRGLGYFIAPCGFPRWKASRLVDVGCGVKGESCVYYGDTELDTVIFTEVYAVNIDAKGAIVASEMGRKAIAAAGEVA